MAATGIVFLLATNAVAATSPARPNILFLMADQMDGRIFDPSSPQLKPPMPNLNALGSSGAVFTTAYNQAPQCVPSRSALMVGLRTDQIGVFDNWIGGVAVDGNASNLDAHCVDAFGAATCLNISMSRGPAASPKTFIDHLSDSGYGIHLFGKMHTGWGLDRYPGAIQAFPFLNGAKGLDPRDGKELREFTRGLGPTTNTKGCRQATAATRPPDTKAQPAEKVDYACMDSCVAQLRAGLFNNATHPQFMYCSIIVPHPPYASNSTFMRAVANLSIGVPEWVPHNESHPNDEATSTLKGLWNADDFKKEDIVYGRRVYFSMCFESDDMLGQIIDALDASGARNNTIVVMISDHGEDNYEHRQQGKNNMYDSASRVAMLLSGPGIAPGQVIGADKALASLNDIFPTILDAAQVPSADWPTNLAGSSLLDLVDPTRVDRSTTTTTAAARRDYVVAQYHSVYSATGSFMLRQGKYKLIAFGPNQFDDDFPPQLFDMEQDPWELHDIAASSPNIVARLSALLHAEVDTVTVDARAKMFARDIFLSTAWKGSAHCQALFEGIYGKGALDASDAKKIETWLGQPCPFSSSS